VSDFAALLQVDMGDGDDFNGALSRASDALVRLSLSASADNQRAVEMTQRAESEAQRWKEEAVFDGIIPTKSDASSRTKAHDPEYSS
jgi:hypothetical protein